MPPMSTCGTLGGRELSFLHSQCRGVELQGGVDRHAEACKKPPLSRALLLAVSHQEHAGVFYSSHLNRCVVGAQQGSNVRCTCRRLCILLLRCLLVNFAHFANRLFIFSQLSSECSLCIGYELSVASINIFCHSVALSFHCLDGVFDKTKVFCFNEA